MRAMRPLAGLSLALALLVQAGAQPLAAAEAVRLRGGVHGEFGRIVFDWPAPVPYQARIESERLVLRFERPAAFDPSRVERALTAYIGKAEVGAGGQEIAFPLKGAFQLKHFPMDERVVVDLYKGSGDNLPSPVPELVAESAKIRAVEAGPTAGGDRQPSGEVRRTAEVGQPAVTESNRTVPVAAEVSRKIALIGSPEEAFQAAPVRLTRDRTPNRPAAHDTAIGDDTALAADLSKGSDASEMYGKAKAAVAIVSSAAQMRSRETARPTPGHGQGAMAKSNRPVPPKAGVRAPRSAEESWIAAPFVTLAGEQDDAVEPAQRRVDGVGNPGAETTVSAALGPGQSAVEAVKAPAPAPAPVRLEDTGEMAEPAGKTEEVEPQTAQETDAPQPDPTPRPGHTKIVDLTAGTGTAADYDPLAALDAPLPPIAAFQEIVERPVFSPLRRPSVAGTTPTPSAPADIGFLKLEGTVISGQKKTALFKDLRSQEILRVRQGDALWGWEIRSISMGRVILRKGNDQRKFVLRFDKVQPKKQMSSKGPEKAEKKS